MTADNYHSKPQREEFFVDSGYYKFHEIYHLLRFFKREADRRACLSGISGDEKQWTLGENSISIINERTGLCFCNAARFKFWRKMEIL